MRLTREGSSRPRWWVLLLAAAWLGVFVFSAVATARALTFAAGQVTEAPPASLSQRDVARAASHTPAATVSSLTPTPTPATKATTSTPADNPHSASPSPRVRQSPSSAAARPQRSPKLAPAASPSAVVSRTFTVVGGTATVRCSPRGPQLEIAIPWDGYQLKIEPEEAELKLKFTRQSRETTLSVACFGGQLRTRVEEHAAGD